jgi:hypothetical protein
VACIRLQSRIEVLEQAVSKRVASDGAADVVIVVSERESGAQIMAELRLITAAESDLDGRLYSCSLLSGTTVVLYMSTDYGRPLGKSKPA